MVGRDDELATLLELADQARAGRPRLALVTGEAGIGKSRLVQEFSDLVADAVVITGHGVDLAIGELPFGVLADTLADLVRQHGPDVLTSVERALLGPLLPGAATGGSDPVRLLAGAVALCGRLAADRLVCWVVEDLQWADEASRDLVSVLGRRDAGRLLVIATVRTGGLVQPAVDPALATYLDGLVRLPIAESLALQRLDADDVRRQLAGLLDEPLPPDVLDHILDVGDGVPFVVEELAAARGRPGLSSLAAVAEARLGSLPGGARRLVDAAAFGEGQLWWPLVERVVGLASDELDEALLDAVRSGILEETQTREGVRFRHALLRDAADRSIPPAARRGWHRRWAEALTTQVGLVPPDLAAIAVARHWHEAADAEQAAMSALAATGVAGRNGGGVEELALWRRLLDLWPKVAPAMQDNGVDRHFALANVLRLAPALGGDVGLGLIQTEEDRAVDDLERAALQVLRATVRAKGALAEGGVGEEQRSIWEAQFRAALPDRLARDGLGLLSTLLEPEDPRATALVSEMRDLAEECDDERTVILSWARQAFIWQAQGRPDVAAEHLQRVIREAQTRMTYELWSMEGNLIWCLSIAGRYAEAEEVAETAFSRVPDPVATGVHFEHIIENVCYGWINTGQWARAEQLIRSGKPYWGPGVRSSDLRLAEIELLRSGRLADLDAWRAAIDAPPVPSGGDPNWIRETVAWHLAGTGDLPAMRSLLAPTWAAPRPQVLTDVLWSPALWAVRFEADGAVRRPDPADRSAAERHVATIEEVAAQLYRFGDLGAAWDAELAAQLARFRGDPCRELFDAAVVAWDGVGHPYDGSLARLCRAEVEVAVDREAARKDVEQALETARELGAAALVQAAEEFLKRYRLASRTVSTPGRPGSLTAREREVLGLLAEGRTNEQIAAELFMSPKTASVHVSRILTKLGAGNRTEAAAVARRIGLL